MQGKLRFFSKYVEAVAFEFVQINDSKIFVHSPYLYGPIGHYVYLITYLITYLFHAAESFLRR
jgi:hypothetical protein